MVLIKKETANIREDKVSINANIVKFPINTWLLDPYLVMFYAF